MYNHRNNTTKSPLRKKLYQPWPDRTGFWIVKHHWGMELAESFLHNDPIEDESIYTIKCHKGEKNTSGPYMPRDLTPDSPQDPPVFLFISEKNPFSPKPKIKQKKVMKEAQDLPKKDTYFSLNEACMRNGTFFRFTGRKKRNKYAQYNLGDFLQFVDKLPNDKFQIWNAKDGRNLLPETMF